MTGAFLIYQTSPKTCLVVALVDGVDVPEWLYVAAGGEHDVLGAGVPRDEVGHVVDAAPVRHPHPRLGVVVLPNILRKQMKPHFGVHLMWVGLRVPRPQSHRYHVITVAQI